ncbi:uncharacterized protein MONBRDRAFT_5934 [Monosiga brevicollis MX1]|uniref:Rho-GAP domain-containing protein n=1 Tax=Monosiga brevicollis TaxID=81824 RepID=A9UR35_MONBE|nr:uncharacterized protein MONBRDRAFT_5934 [Monosiga brevicollis MX1]EDQ92179.1 predicted protein [Monosiga brevicollis MX1]|eukprot:XP_001743465.1 hypothetical protein [Monosiga brevicollis MX1]
MASAFGALRSMVTGGRKQRSSAPASMDVVKNSASTGLSGTLHIVVSHATDLPVGASCDPYCELRVVGGGDQRRYRTVVRRKTLSPEWNETVVRDKSKHKHNRDREMASARIDLHALIDGKEQALNMSLSPAGRLFMSISFDDASNLFGLPLADVCRREQRSIPHLITKCVYEIDQRGLQEEGLYRKAGNKRIIDILAEQFVLSAHEAEPIIQRSVGMDSIHPFAPYCHVRLQSQADHMSRMRLLRGTIEALPKENRDTLKFLFDHFARVLEHTASNLMSAEALATCLGPTIFTPASNDARAQPFFDVHSQNAITQVGGYIALSACISTSNNLTG